jgi:hypothetical protein
MFPKLDPLRALMDFAEELKAHRANATMSRDDLAAKVNYSASLIAHSPRPARQIDLIGAALAIRPQELQTAPNGGSACVLSESIYHSA